MPRRSFNPGFAVPMSKPRYSCVESQANTSPPNCSASHTPSVDFPDAVGPTTATSGSSDVPGFIETEYAKRGKAAQQAQPERGGDYQAPAGERVSPIGVFNRQIIQKHDADLDVRTVESRRQRFKGIGRTDGGDRRAIQRLFSGAHLACRIVIRNAAVRHDFKSQQNAAAVSEQCRL